MAPVPTLTVQSWPVRAFCGWPPSPGGLNLGSIHEPVQVGGPSGSVTALSRLSLYVISVRPASPRGVGRQPGLPVHLVTGEERQVDARVPAPP